MTTNPLSLYFSAPGAEVGARRNQLMQVYVQKWTRMTFPRKADADSGGELSHASARSRDASPD